MPPAIRLAFIDGGGGVPGEGEGNRRVTPMRLMRLVVLVALVMAGVFSAVSSEAHAQIGPSLAEVPPAAARLEASAKTCL